MLAPGLRRRSWAGVHNNFIARRVQTVGRTDAGRLKLPLLEEVCS